MTKRHALLLLAVTMAVLLPARLSAQVRGQVTDAASGDPIAGAVVWLRGATTHVTSSTGDGAYAFDAIAPGSYCIRVDSPGYAQANVCIAVSHGAHIIVDLPLAARPLTIAPIVVTGRRGATHSVDGNAGDSVRATIAGGSLALPGTRTAALAAAQLSDLAHMPSSDPTGGGRPHALYVWGSSADRGRVLLDGASLNAPLHLGALLPPLDPAIVATANMHSGGISPRYDGGTSYVMDFTTRAASRPAAAWGELDLLAGRIGAEAVLGERVGVIMSARRVNDEVIDGLVSSDFGYGYADGIARADIALGTNAGIHVTGLMTRESVRIPRDLASDRASWSNRAATAEWRHEDGDDARSAGVSISRGIADLPLLSAVGGHLEASLDRVNGTAERRWRRGDIVWHAGAELEHLTFRRRSRATQDPITGETGRIECTAALPCSHSRTTLAAAFAEASITPASHIQLSIGTRAMYDVDAGRIHMLPRAALIVLPSPHYAVTLSGGRFSQPYVTETPLATGDAEVDLPIDVAVARALHLELDVARHAGGSHIRAGVHVRRHARVEPAARTRTVPGADVSLEQTLPVGLLRLAYSISGGSELAYDETISRSRQQLLTVGWSGSAGRWSADLNAAYGSGLPLTSIVLEQPVDAEIVLQPTRPSYPGREMHTASSGRSYLRVDASIGAEWRLGASGTARLMPYVRIINALGQRESLFFFQDGDVTHPPRSLAALPAVPMIGVRWQF